VLGRYRLLERLGAGGFGEVWRAHDELLHREVAVKRIPTGPDCDSERAAREALATARLCHPAIVALYEASAADDAFYLISELVEGETLAELIAEDALADEEILEIALALAQALEHAHSRGVIHRDIKPQNVLVPHIVGEPAGAAKLTDFGGASLAGEDALTRTGDVLGTLAYMAPEQSEGGEVGEEADLYALALVLYEALTGVNPVRGPTPAATARRIGRPLEPLGRRRRDLPPTFAGAIDTALAPSPQDRGSLETLRSALEETLERGLRRPRRRLPRSPRSHASPAPLADAKIQPRAQIQPRELPGAIQPREPPVRQPPPAVHPQPEDVAEDPAGGLPRLALPRLLWLGLAVAAILWEVSAGRPGVAVLAAAALAPLLALPRRSGPGWMIAVLAPVLGLVGLAGAYPAIAGQARRWRARAALGALGYWWLTLAEPLLARRLWLGPHTGVPPRAVWEGSASLSAEHLIVPVLAVGVLLGALLWAAAAVVLPWIVRGTSAAVDVVAVTVWSAAIASFAPLLDAGALAHAAHPTPRGAAAGAVVGGIFALAARALRGPV